MVPNASAAKSERLLHWLLMLWLVGCGRSEKHDAPAPLPQGATQATIQILRRSPTPDPKRSDYADCLYTAEAKVLEITSGARLPREIILDLPCFSKRTLEPEAAFRRKRRSFQHTQ